MIKFKEDMKGGKIFDKAALCTIPDNDNDAALGGEGRRQICRITKPESIGLGSGLQVLLITIIFLNL